jgi:DNA primase catalytic core
MQRPNRSERDSVVDQLGREVDLVSLAEELGVKVFSRASLRPKGLCPFHEDRTPSLVFFPSDGENRARYHCFACGAHGDVFNLVMKQRSLDFRGALEWIAHRYNRVLPTWKGKPEEPRKLGLSLAFEAFSSPNDTEIRRIQSFSEARRFDYELLRKAEVFAVDPPKLVPLAERLGREATENLLASGLIQRVELRIDRERALPTELPLRDFFKQPRIIFAIRDDNRRLVGFAGRAISPGDEPKYLYSPGFPRSETLYRLDRVRSVARKQATVEKRRMDLFVVEGLLDAIRLEALDFNAVAVLGAQLTVPQADQLSVFAKELDRDGIQLVVHLYLDTDVPGRHALRSVLPLLLETAAKDATGFLV